MKNISLNFFGEEITIRMPTSLSSLRQAIIDNFMFSPSDAAEVILSYAKDIGKVIIQTEQDFTNFIKNKIGKIDLDISQESKLYKENLKSLEKESEEAKKELEICLKKKEEIKKAKEDYIKEEMAKIKEINMKLKKLLKQKKTFQSKMNKEKRKFQKEEKENNDKIKVLKEKLGMKEEKPKEKKVIKKTILKSKKKVIKLRGQKKVNEKKEVHALVTCDGCNMCPIVGKRYKCESCPNFDFCEECYKNKKEKHGHSFKQVETKMILKEILNKYCPKTENSEGKAVHLRCSCDGCGMNPIVGTRYKCSICDNFDYCENCEELHKNDHDHPFIKIYNPNMDL